MHTHSLTHKAREWNFVRENNQINVNIQMHELDLLEQEIEKYQYCIKINKVIDTLATPHSNNQIILIPKNEYVRPHTQTNRLIDFA